MVLIVEEDEIPMQLLAAHVDRSNREDHKKTDHDSLFSKWKLLICPRGWKNGKGGAVTRYRLENLPESSGPGNYELAVCKLPSRDRHGKLEPNCVVYVGEAENIRARLQQYGRNGTHLCRKNGFAEKECILFGTIFERGCSIIYRWASMKSKAAAKRTEARLLEKYDYAWNKCSNGALRHNDILWKLDKIVSNKIKSNKQVNGRCRRRLNYGGDGGSSFTSRNLNYGYYDSSFTPRWLDHGGDDTILICGASTNNGAPCERPVSGNGRCWQHLDYSSSSSHCGDDIILICGASTNNGAPCERPVSGNGRCWQHLDYSSSSSSSSSGCFTCGTFNYDPQWFFLTG